MSRIRFALVPIESTAPVRWFALIRLGFALAAAAAVAILGLPFEGELFAMLAAVAVPWALLTYALARHSPAAALHPLVAAGDFALLVAIQAVVPETWGAIRFVGLFMVAAHAHFQGELRGVGIALAGAAALLVGGVLADIPLEGRLQAFYEALFAVSALATAFVLGGLRTIESAARLRARGLVRRTIAVEDEVRRRLATSIHDGPVQELVSLEMILGAVRQAMARGDAERAAAMLAEAEGIASRNVRALRDEIVALGPDAYRERSFEVAVSDLLPVWRRRFDLDVRLECDRVPLEPEVEGALFRIAQEAVVNAGRHSGAGTIAVRLRGGDGHAVLTVADDGRGFRGVNPSSPGEPGHLGLAAMRERAEAAGGELTIDSGPYGTVVRVDVPFAES